MSTTDPNPTPDTSAATSSFAEGQKLAGCYVLTQRLSSGHGSDVWLAQDEVLGKSVSLHFVPEAVRKDARALQELRQDIKRDRQLVHPNILRVYDLVEEPDWTAISMDAAEGESLALLLERQPNKRLTLAQIQSWVVPLAQTLDDAHKINVLHRDLTPTNILLTSTGKPVVANFGISRVIQDALSRAGGGESPRLAYVSPQLIDGQPAARTDDIYSLGAVLYSALTGAPPFVGADLAGQIRAGLAPTAALQALRKEGLMIPPEWQKIIVGCLEKSPEVRPQSAAEVARRLATEGIEAAAAGPAAAFAGPAEVRTPVVETGATSSPRKPAEPTPSSARKEPESLKSPAFAPPKKRTERKLPANYNPRPYPTESRVPAAAIVGAAALLVVIAIVYHFASGKRHDNATTVELRPTVPPEKVAPVNATKAPDEIAAVPRSATPAKPSTPVPAPQVAAVAPSATPKIATSTPKPQTPPAVVAAAPSGPERAIAEKLAALEKAKQAMQVATLTQTELLKKHQQAETLVADAQKAIDEKAKAAAPVKKAAEDVLAQRKKLEEEQKAAEAAAQQAQQVAADKAQLAEAARRSLEEIDKKNQDKLAAQKKADAELEALQNALAEKQRMAADAAKVAADADTARQHQLAAITRTEQEVEQAKAAAAEVQRQKEAAEAERRKLDQELADMQRTFKEQMEKLEERRKSLEGPGAIRTSPTATEPVRPPTATPPAVVPLSVATPAAILAPPKGTAPVSTTLAMKTTPAPLVPPVVTSATPSPTITTAAATTNSLGMKFVAVGDVEFSIWQTRVKDFEAFAKAVNLRSTSWKSPGFKQSPDHPVVNVTWQEAVAFCKWLSDKEHKEGTLPTHQFYRLPTDLEWSKAVGLPDELGKTPEARDMGVQDVYPWGTAWPPPAGAGNYTGEETGSDVAIKGFDDSFAWTSPVGSFAPNKFGLYDMGGNVWQWCMDNWNADSKAKVLRGASWYNGALKLSLLSSCRVHAAPDSSTDNYGFRIVRAVETAKAVKK